MDTANLATALAIGLPVFWIGLYWLYKLAVRQSRPRIEAQAGRHAKTKEDPFAVLVKACYGNAAQASRLAEYEQSRSPGLSFTEGCRRAYDRLMRDRS